MVDADKGGPGARLVLASTSPWRAELLGRLGLPFVQADPELDEGPWKEQGLPAQELVTQLARAKAAALAGRHPGSLILGADQVVDLDGMILGKPGTTRAAVLQLKQLAGRSHQLITGLALLDSDTGEFRVEVDVHQMTLRPLSLSQIESYVRRDGPEQCAGSYRLVRLGLSLFESVEGQDYSAIIGLPLIAVTRLLSEAGHDPLGSFS